MAKRWSCFILGATEPRPRKSRYLLARVRKLPQDRLLDLLYSAPGDDSAWADFLRQTSQLIHSDTAEIALLDHKNSNFALKHSVEVPREAAEAYNLRFGQMDEWYVRARGRVTVGYVGAGEVLCS